MKKLVDLFAEYEMDSNSLIHLKGGRVSCTATKSEHDTVGGGCDGDTDEDDDPVSIASVASTR
jgi:hypothetical protein